MKIAALVLMAILLSCTKNNDVLHVNDDVPEKTEPESCNFGQQIFSSVKRTTLFTERKRSPLSPSPTPAPIINGPVILLDFDGHLVSKTSWNVRGDINCMPANMTDEEITNVVNRVAEDYSPFNVTVTTDESVYNNANPNKRTRVIITETWEWFGKAGGTSYLNSFTWGDNTPCFVFSSLLDYDAKKVGEASSHEAGHTIGLRHQAYYNQCVFANEYHSGWGSGEISWAPIMGNSYYKNVTTWSKGPMRYGCNNLQDDLSIIASVLGYRQDDYPNAIAGATSILSATTGMINSNTDIDFFSISIADNKTISVTPMNYDSDQGANLDLQLKVFDNRGVLLHTVNSPLTLKANITLPSGSYYLQIEATDNEYTSRYGMLGRYIISVD